MFISVVLNTEYWDYASRTKWYLKNLMHCKENNWIIITHDYIRRHFEEFQSEINDRFFREFEMRKFTIDEVSTVEQYYLPDELFDEKEKNCGSRTQTLIELTENAFPEIENILEDIIFNIKEKHPNEKIEGIFHCLESFQFLRNVANRLGIPLISYSFSAIRKPHGYRQTLYHSNLDGYLYTGDECRKRYDRYLSEDNDPSIPILSNREIIAIIGKERTLPLLSIIDKTPKYELGFCGESFAILPQFFSKNVYTDDDIFYETNRLYKKNEICHRSHAAQLDMIGIDRSGVHNDPAPFILSCKRLAGVRSQIMLKALLWKRPAIVMKNTLGFDFLCAKDYISTDTPSIEKLNYYIFGYLIPSGLMFSKEYWKWRLSKPAEHEIYNKHIGFIFKELNIPKTILKIKEEAVRFEHLLIARGCDKYLLEDLQHGVFQKDVNFDVAISKFLINSISQSSTYWRLNYIENNTVVSELIYEGTDVQSIDFYPLDDVAGWCELVSVDVNDKELPIQNITSYKPGYNFLSKVKGHYSFIIQENLNKNKIVVKWHYKSLSQFLYEQ